MLTVSAEDVTPKEINAPDYIEPGLLWKTDYIGASSLSDKALRGPQAFINDIRGKYTIQPHFHLVDQFQIFVRGRLRFGKDRVEPVTIHYTDGYTPYGPIAGDDGMTFFNLRPRADIGSYRMPGLRDKLLRRAGRHRLAHCEVRDPKNAGCATRTELIDPEADGLCVFETIAGPGSTLPRDVADGSGRYELVLAGTLEIDGTVLPADSLLWASAGERLPVRRAGEGGVQVLTVQAPTD